MEKYTEGNYLGQDSTEYLVRYILQQIAASTDYQTELNDSTMAPRTSVVKDAVDNLQGQITALSPGATAGASAETEVLAARIGEDGTEYASLKARLDAMEYKPISVNTFTAAPPVSEIGSSQTITLAWSLNKQATSQNINGSPVTGNSKQYTGVTTGQTYTLNVSDGTTSASKSVSVSFANRVYFGAAADLSTVTSLDSILSNVPGRTITVNAGAGEYIIYAIPARLGDVEFYVSGFEGGFEPAVEQTLTNGSGYQETYKVYRSTNPNLGETTVEIREV